MKFRKCKLLSTFGVYGGLLVLLIGAAIWLGFDLAAGRNRILAERSAMALQKSQFMSQWFGTTIVSADYVLRDINGKVSVENLKDPTRDPDYFKNLSAWLSEKVATVPGVDGITIYDSDCIFRAAADPRMIGFKSNQKSCQDPAAKLENRTYIQYVPAEKSASKRPAILVSRHHLSPDGRLLGGALAAIDLSFAQEWITSFPVDENDVLAVVDGDGILLARNPPLPAAIGTRTPAPAGQPSFGEQRSSANFIAVSPLDGRKRIYGLSKIEDIPLLIIIGFDLSQSLDEWLRRAWQLSLGFLGLLVLSIMALRTHLTVLGQREEMRALATTDPLTGAANRRHLVEEGEQEVSRSLRYGTPMSLIMVDIDRFKAINDTWGHPTGDRAIQALARAMTAAMRDLDVVGRLGGEEFAAILPGTEQQGACTLAERLRETIENAVSATADDGQTVRFTISVGVTTVSPGDTGFEDILGRADKALYAAKNGGRNRVVFL